MKKMGIPLGLVVLVLGAAAAAIEPADKDLIPEARRVLNYLESIYGGKTLSGMSSYGGRRPVYEMTGLAPAVYGEDAFGWNKPKWGESYRQVMQNSMDSLRTWWQAKGGIPQLQFHWGRPDDPAGTAWVGGDGGTGPVDMKAFVTPGTKEHEAAMEDLRRTADYMEQLYRARVPVLWRPFHEVDGGWFWWTDQEMPENTAAAWRMMFEYLVKARGLHNLIWVYNPGVWVGGLKRPATLEEEIAFRKRYYPGEAYVDIAGIDIYPNAQEGYGEPMEDTYRKAYEIMKAVSPGKILALCETAALVSPERMAAEGPRWLYCLPWFAGGANPADWIRTSFAHEQYLTLDELPLLGDHNICPQVRLIEPADGQQTPGGRIQLKAVAGDRNGNMAKVTFYAIRGAWKNWHLRSDEEVRQAIGGAQCPGEVCMEGDGSYVLGWTPEPGLWSVAAVAEDSDGKSTVSNVARIAVGVENFALKRAVSTSSAERSNAARAVDGDLFVGWSGDKEGSQWLAVDLGAVRTVGAIAVTWWKAYARAYHVEVSTDGATWREVYRQTNKRNWHGDCDVIRFEPIRGRHVRLVCTERGTDWGGYSVDELAIFEGLPQDD